MAMAEQSTVYSRIPEMRGTIKLTARFTQPQDKEEVPPPTRLRASTTTTNKTDAFWCSSTVAAALAIVLFSPSLDFGREWPDRSEEGEREARCLLRD